MTQLQELQKREIRLEQDLESAQKLIATERCKTGEKIRELEQSESRNAKEKR